jgi:hypothetical protein
VRNRVGVRLRFVGVVVPVRIEVGVGDGIEMSAGLVVGHVVSPARLVAV